MTLPAFVLGLDPGQAADPSALCALERHPAPGGEVYHVCGLHRFPLGTSYVDVCNGLGVLLPEGVGTILAVDRTGVGRAVTDLLASLALPAAVVPVTITAGHEARRDEEGAWTVPKKEIVSALLLLFGQGRLVIHSGQALAPVLRQELADFRVRVTSSAHETFSHREGRHDDLVLAVGIAAWVALRHPPFGPGALGRGAPRPAVRVPAGTFHGGDFRHFPGGI